MIRNPRVVSVRALDIDVPPELVSRWIDWLMPELQPYVVPVRMAADRGWDDARDSLPMEVIDSFEIYSVSDESRTVLLSRSDARTLPTALRRAQAARHRWPSTERIRNEERVFSFVNEGRRPSRHAEVSEEIWRAARTVLPGAREVAGTFANGSGPNCFAMVMASAGIVGAADEWMQIEPFEEWLAQSAVPGGRDVDAGTVMVWRTTDGQAAHAGVTLGDGWYLHKRSQGWMSPTKVLTTIEGKYSSRARGLCLHRYTLATRQPSL